jgi:hypothetical protein
MAMPPEELVERRRQVRLTGVGGVGDDHAFLYAVANDTIEIQA